MLVKIGIYKNTGKYYAEGEYETTYMQMYILDTCTLQSSPCANKSQLRNFGVMGREPDWS